MQISLLTRHRIWRYHRITRSSVNPICTSPRHQYDVNSIRNPQRRALEATPASKQENNQLGKRSHPAQSAHKSSACCNTVCVAFSCLSGG
jgi:hypothetical protein